MNPSPFSDIDITALAGQIADAVRTSNWRGLAALALVACLFLLRALGGRIPKIGRHLLTDRAGAARAPILGAAGAILTALAAGRGVDAPLLGDGLLVGLTGAGAWSVGKRVLRKGGVAGSEKPALPRGSYHSKKEGKYVSPGDPGWSAAAYEAVTGEAWATASRGDDPGAKRYFVVQDGGEHREVRIDSVSDDGRGVYLKGA